jgi:hypothetical protein
MNKFGAYGENARMYIKTEIVPNMMKNFIFEMTEKFMNRAVIISKVSKKRAKIQNVNVIFRFSMG